MPKTLGIIGGGQLGMMLTEAATNHLSDVISNVIVLDPTEHCPASLVGAEQIIADFKDQDAIMELSKRADIITYEIESGDSEVLEAATANAQINPAPQTLKIIQDKYLQKTFLAKHGIAVPDFTLISDIKSLYDALDVFGYPALLKARRDAYDGRGNYKIDSPDVVCDAYDTFKDRTMMLEQFVPFVMEVSVIAARNTAGDVCTYPLVENIHEENILRTTIAPARVSDEISKKADDIAQQVMKLLKGAGVFGIEMFVTINDEILINEIAPRVHNSGHHSLQSCVTSQFEQHLRAILGMELGDTTLKTNAIMYNILGVKEYTGKYKNPQICNDNYTFLKMYGKEISKPLRKIGHLNLLGKPGGDDVQSLLKRLDSIKSDAVAYPIS